jgi:hypothetical protein
MRPFHRPRIIIVTLMELKVDCGAVEDVCTPKIRFFFPYKGWASCLEVVDRPQQLPPRRLLKSVAFEISQGKVESK